MMRDEHEMHRADALLWMLDHRGDTVHAVIEVVHGDASYAVVTADGVLRRWRDDPSAAAVRDSQRYDIEGLFAIGEMSLDLTDIADDAEVTIDERESVLHVRLDEHVWLLVTETKAAK